ncbi:aspartate aminotransferase family protein, partial [bacterium]|nr:aspartate aminotransferase family protein [bacterium]
LERVRSLEALYRERLERLRPLPLVGDVRALGMVAAVELVSDRKTKAAFGYLDAVGPRIQREALAHGILLRPLGNVVYVLPPLCITDGEVKGVFDAIEEIVGSLS